jgi:hypothetical protein
VLRDLTPETFRELLHEANNPDRRYIINFSRASIFGAGVRHHSPIGGYLEREDLIFVLDVNRDASRAIASVFGHGHARRRQEARLAADRVSVGPWRRL